MCSSETSGYYNPEYRAFKLLVSFGLIQFGLHFTVVCILNRLHFNLFIFAPRIVVCGKLDKLHPLLGSYGDETSVHSKVWELAELLGALSAEPMRNLSGPI
jgi:hypothetical protein